MSKKILIGPSSFAERDSAPLNRLVEDGWEVVENPFRRKLTKVELLDLLGDGVVGLIAGLEPIDRDVLERSVLRVISRCGVGLSNVDLEAAEELGIKVCSTPDAPTEAVAELTLGAMLSLLRMLPQMDRDLHQGQWIKRIGAELRGKAVAIIGFGRIGRRLAELLQAFAVRVLVIDPYSSKPVVGIPLLSLEEALPQADIITLHCSGEECILDERKFALFKAGTYLLNAARGSLVDHRALAKALDEGRVAGAWIDTFEQEPYAGPLIQYPQVILTPHVGSYTVEGRRQMEMEAVENLLEALADTGVRLPGLT